MRGDVMRAANGRPVLATPVMREMETAPMAAPPPRVIGNRNTGTMARVGNAQRRRSSTWILVALGILGVLAVVALGIGLYLASRPQLATVPDLRGLTRDQAEASLQGSRLNGNAQPVANAQCTKDRVFFQSPAANTQLAQGGQVSYQVCAGPETVPIPSVVGKDRASAQTALQNAGLTANFQPVDSDQPKDVVVKVDPAEGSAVAKGSAVTVSISLQNEGQVPRVTGLTRSEAISRLRNAHFTNIQSVDTLANSPSQVGVVTGQQPDSGSVKKFSDLIQIFVGRAQEQPSPTPTSPSPSPSQTGP
jgi:serine/threonine-protein kinase